MNNGFMSSQGQSQSQLIAGQALRLPQFTPLSNNVKNSLPYQNLMSIMEGNLSPYVAIDQESSFLGVILEIVAVVVAIAAAPYLAPQIFGVASALALSAAAAGAAGLMDFFGQELLVQLGVEKNIAWSDILGAALAAGSGVKGGLMSSVKIGSGAVMQAAMRVGLVNVASQFAELAAGDIKTLDFKQILASMVGAGLGQKILPEFHHEFNWGQTEEDAASAVMDGFIDSAIEGKSLNVENMFEAFAQSAAEDWLSTGRGAISQANAQDSNTKPSTGKIPAPADTENTWKNRGRNGEKKAAANDARWKRVGAAATHQKTQATNYMLNQMQQAAAKSADFLSPDDLFKIYSAQVGAYDDLNAEAQASESNSNNSSWQNAARASTSVNSSRGFFATAAHDFSAFVSGVKSDAINSLYQHQNNPLLHVFIEADFSINQAIESPNGQVLANNFDADIKAMDPFITGYRALYGVDPMTGVSANRMQGALGTALNLLPGVGGLGKSGLRLAEAGWARFFEGEGVSVGVGNGSQSVIRSRIFSNISESKVARASSNFKIHAYVEQALFRLNVNTELDEATFWSGEGNQTLATDFAMNMDKMILDMTPGGKYLEALDLFKQYPYEQAVKPWDALSRRFAENASGNVYAFVEGARPTSVFNRVEYPALIENPNVTNIIFSKEHDDVFRQNF